MNMRELTDEEKVLLAEYRLCEAQVQERICNTVHVQVADEKSAESAFLVHALADGNRTAGDS